MRGRRVGVSVALCQVPACLEELPRHLEGNRCFSGPCGQGEEDAILAFAEAVQDTVDGDLLVEPERPASALVGERDRGEAVSPGVRLNEGHRPELVRRGIARLLAFPPGLHVNAVDALPVGRVGVANRQLGGVVLGLPNTSTA